MVLLSVTVMVRCVNVRRGGAPSSCAVMTHINLSLVRDDKLLVRVNSPVVELR